MNKLLDTNIVLYLLGGKLNEPLPEGEYFVSVITEIELLSYPAVSIQEEQQIQKCLADLTIVELLPEVKQLAIPLRRQYHLKLPDAIIAATALVLKAELLTNDLRLARVTELQCRQLKLIQ